MAAWCTDMYLAKVKSPKESKGPWDFYNIIRVIPGDEAFQPLSESTCPLVARSDVTGGAGRSGAAFFPSVSGEPSHAVPCPDEREHSHDFPAEKADAIKAAEKAYAQDLQRQGKWVHLWRIAGTLRQHLHLRCGERGRVAHAAFLPSPVPFMDIVVTPLARHPSAI